MYFEVDFCVTLTHYPKYDIHPSYSLQNMRQNCWTAKYRSLTYMYFMRSIFMSQQSNQRTTGSPECGGYAELEQTWKYKSPQCSISCHPYRSIRNKFDPVIKMVKVNPGLSFQKYPREWAYHYLVKAWQHFKAFYYSHHFVPVLERSLLPHYFI